MMNNDSIAPDLLHKGSADDVLIAAPRDALPLYVNEALIAANGHNPLVRSFVASADPQRCFEIAPALQKKSRMDGVGAADEWNRVRALPYQIVAAQMQSADTGIDNLEFAVAALCESIPPIRRASSFRFINNADNYFFYRKAHEHVPGTMFIEAARQAVYHHLYHHTDHARGAVTVSVNELNASFFAYAELMYPIELVVDNMIPSDATAPKKIHLRVAFYQRQTLFATVDTKATVIDMPLFEKTRNIFIYSNDWFAPLQPSKLACTISDSQGRKVEVQLLGLGKSGCVTSKADLADPVTLNIVYEGKLSFTANVRRTAQGERAAWEFVEADFSGLQVISDMIKRGFVYLDEPALAALKP
ncbi:AfsA-related hotdog domain-containing protein [Pseudomonas sp. Eth.TT006]